MRVLYVTRHFNRAGYYILEQLIADGFDVAGVVLRDEPSPYLHRMLRPFAIASYRLRCWYYRCEPCKFLRSEEILAREHGVEVVKTNDVNADGFYARLETLAPDVLLVGGGWHQLIAERVFSYPQYGALNVHPSLLPLFRGTTVHRWQIYHGVDESGVSVHYLDKTFDTGEVLAQDSVAIEETDTPQDLAEKTGRIAAPLVSGLLRKLAGLPKGERLPGVPQQSGGQPPFRAWKWTEETLALDWRRPLRDLYNLIRAAHQESYQYKGPVLELSGRRLLVRCAAIRAREGYPPAPAASDEVTVLRADDEGIHLGRGSDEDVLVITQVQPYGARHYLRRAFRADGLVRRGLVAVGDTIAQ